MKYANRDPATLEPHYSAHVAAMTEEGLHEKSAIAAELAFRDAEIVRLRKGPEFPHCTCGANAVCAGAFGQMPTHRPDCALSKLPMGGAGGTFTIGGEKDPGSGT